VAYHVVKAGDTVSSISRRYGVPADTIRVANGIVNDKLYTGQRVLLAVRNSAAMPKATTTTHVVRSGETLAGIASAAGTSVSALVSANGIKNPNVVQIGATLTVPAGGGGAAFACPVPGARFMNDWGFPRSGGRFHEGNDLFAARGTPVHAPAAGTTYREGGSLGGNQVKLVADSGTVFYGMHLDRFGKIGRVAAGDVIGYVGDTGAAKGGPVHLHFEVHPGGGSAVNPYPMLVGRC
jgi:murein DD-endopeptidase MepM/ murein hydrolase activator NlpD